MQARVKGDRKKDDEAQAAAASPSLPLLQGLIIT